MLPYHSRRFHAYQFREKAVQKKINLLAAFRLVVFLALVVGVSFLFGGDYVYHGAFIALLAAGAFLYLMVLHDRCYRFKQQCALAASLTRADEARAAYRFKDIAYEAPIHFEREHPFARDLDLNGPFSLLKAIDTCFHHRSKSLLKRWMDRIDEPEAILRRQEAVRDLTRRKRFRMKLALASHLNSLRDLNPEDLRPWLEMPTPWTLRLGTYLACRILALVTTTAVILRFFFQIDVLPWLPLVLANLAVFYAMDFAHKRYYFEFMDRGKAIAAVGDAIRIFETLKVEAPLLREIQAQLRPDGEPAGPRLKQLLSLHDHLQYRANGFAHFLLNALLLWDQHYLRQLNQWRQAHGSRLPTWIGAVFRIEALAALANFRWLYPGRVFPELVAGDTIHLEASDLAHPAIGDDVCVGNDYRITQNGVVHLVTGSNMSGKSTFLRTVGLNWVLARMGAPVRAGAMRCSLPKLWTSIRVEDNLAEGVSFFYAEVSRLKMILEDIQKDEKPVFYLLDEILKGTNSRERLIACKALIRFLIEHRASGLITTHDLELLALAEAYPKVIVNYHFQERVRGDEMYFDYRLKPGELTSTNALRVMRFAEVPLDFEE